MLKQLIDEKSNEIFVLQTAGKGTSCPACVWQTVLHAGTAVHTADVCEPALSLSRAHIYLTLCTQPNCWILRHFNVARMKTSYHFLCGIKTKELQPAFSLELFSVLSVTMQLSSPGG